MTIARSTPIRPLIVLIAWVALTLGTVPAVFGEPPAPVALPRLSLKPGDNYFSLDGKQSFLLFRNITGKTKDDFYTLLDWARRGGTKVIRLHLTHGWWGDPWINKDWSVNEKWAKNWDGFFSQAQAYGISVMPVFGVWADWNNGLPADVFHFWQYNPLNKANGGPLDSPVSLFQADSDTQKKWLAWVGALAKRWQGRKNIAAWEIFSEINLASGAPGETDAKGAVSVSAAAAFTEKAAALVREADQSRRPVTLSLAVGAPFTNEWGPFYDLKCIDCVEIHPYHDQLDRELVIDVRRQIERFHRPVMIGECGLWQTGGSPNAVIGIQHAMWAGLVSGAMNGRALWWHDGYAQYDPIERPAAFAFMQAYAETERPVAKFIQGIDFSGFRPLTSGVSSGVWGAAAGNERLVLGWFRDALCEPPQWNLRSKMAGQSVAITVPGTAADWKVDFYDTKTGTDIIGTAAVVRNGDTVTVPLPDFKDDIAFKMYPAK